MSYSVRLPFSLSGVRATQWNGDRSPAGDSHNNASSITSAFDFAVAKGTAVLAVAAGRVVSIRESVPDGKTAASQGSNDPSLGPNRAGNFVTLVHNEGTAFQYYTSYFHLGFNTVNVVEGQKVSAGDPLGLVGWTGERSGSHIHVHGGTTLKASGDEQFADAKGETDFLTFGNPDGRTSGNYTFNGTASLEQSLSPIGLALSGNKAVISDSVGSGYGTSAWNTDDYFKFTAPSTGTISVNLTGLSANLDLRILDSKGLPLQQSTNGGAAAESIAGFTVKAGATYLIHVDPVRNAASNYSLALSFQTSARDTSAPQLIRRDPADDSKKVPVDADLILGFDEKVVKGSGVIEIWSKSGKVESIDVGSSRVSLSSSGTTVTVDLKNDLLAGKDYYVLMSAGVFKDTVGNAFAGIEKKTSFNFTTAPDTKAPLLTSSKPGDEEKGVSASADIVLKFNEAVTDGKGKIEIYKSDGKLFESIDVDSSRVDFSSSGKTVTIDPKGKLASGTSYYVIMKPGVIEDLAGNDFGGLRKGDLNFTVSGKKSSSIAATRDGDQPLSEADDVDVSAQIPLPDGAWITPLQAAVATGAFDWLTEPAGDDFLFPERADEALSYFEAASSDQLGGATVGPVSPFTDLSMSAFGEGEGALRSGPDEPLMPITEGWWLP